jgi:integrase
MLPDVEEALLIHHHSDDGRASQYVFTNSEGGFLHRDNVRNRIWHSAIARAGLRTRNPYQTRHTFASLMLHEGEDPAWVARMLGHVDLRMIYERYGKYIRNRTRQDGTRFTSALQRAKMSVERL